MNVTVYFDNQTGGMAIKINDKTINHLLAAEMPASKFICP